MSYKRCKAEFYYVGKIPRIRILAARRCSEAWFYNGFIHHQPLSEVHALYRVPF